MEGASEKIMTARDIILGRIKEALRKPAPRKHEAPIKSPAGFPGPEDFQEWLPPVGEEISEQFALFAQHSVNLKTVFLECDSLEAASATVKEIASRDGWKKVGTHSGSLSTPLAESLGLPLLSTDGGYETNELETCDAGITECEYLIAQTGTVMVSGPASGGRALSVLPPHHVVIARRSQMLPDLTAALKAVSEKYGANFPSFLSFTTGPSRTGDIERILVLGAHGPKQLTVIAIP